MPTPSSFPPSASSNCPTGTWKKPSGAWTNQHLLSVNGKFRDFEIADLLAEARRFGIGTAPRVIDEVRAAIRTWRGCAQQAGLPEMQMQEIERQFLLLG